MRLILIVFGVLNILIGLLPTLNILNYLPKWLLWIPTQGIWSGSVVGILGIIMIYFGFKAERIK